jgi:penicillin-binding protein 2
MRKALPIALISLITIIFLGRLAYLQLIDDSYKTAAIDFATKKVYDYPQRGYMFDRNGKLLVANQPAYDVMAVPLDVRPFDTLAFANILNITPQRLKLQLNKAWTYSPRLPSIITPQLTKKEYAYLQEQLHQYNGFYIQKRQLRDYQTSHGANFLGYIAEVNQRDLDNKPYYQSGDLIGRQGVESQYEELLRGIRGVKYYQRDNFNRNIGSYEDGIYDTISEKGIDLTLTIDIDLQTYGEELMENKRGGVVAIEPSTGEILALVTAPNYDPDELVGRKRSKNYTRMWYDSISKPLYDRGLQAMYPPGSPFKIFTGLAALQEGVISVNERVSCYGGYSYGRSARMACHGHSSPVDMISGIAYSCNSYFAQIYRRTIEKPETPQLGIEAWSKHMKSFGFGNFLGYDLPAGRKGRIPDSTYYNWAYRYPTYKWYATATLSNAIGQGEIETTPIQLANAIAAVANKGWFYRPHILKEMNGKAIVDSVYNVKNETSIDKKYFEPIIEGMHDVYKYGTARYLGVEDIEICGKTGTVQNYAIVDGERKQLTDHSIFVAFAPKDNPKIAIAVFVENGYYGARYAGRIASLMIEKYLKGSISRTDMENWLLSRSLEDEYAKPYSGEPFEINQ